jgi:alkylation response protein AidB-like acyl-CoA dehydrogenase
VASTVEPFSSSHDELRLTVRMFVQSELQPFVRDWEIAEWFPSEVFERLGELGLLGLTVPEEFGGQGGDYWATVVLVEELARAGSAGLSRAVAVQTDLATPPILRSGTTDQIKQYLVPSVAGTRIACFGLSEAGGGDDSASIRTTARRDGTDWLISGTKPRRAGPACQKSCRCSCPAALAMYWSYRHRLSRRLLNSCTRSWS